MAPSAGTATSRTLRIALAMRGGVSLAVWIGGALAEIDVFRRASLLCKRPSKGDRRRVYWDLLDESIYDGVEIDILAGASAGGLNAVLYGVAQTCGAVTDAVAYNTWINDGALWELLHKRGFGSIAAPLRGDGHFFEVMGKALSALVAGGDEGIRAERVTIELAATLLADSTSPEQINRARFSFVNRSGSLTSRYHSIPNSPEEAATEAGKAALDRLALAGRATSSFPGAFEPARVYSFAPNPQVSANGGDSGVALCGYGSQLQGLSERVLPQDSDAAVASGLTVNMAWAFPYARGASSPRAEDSFAVIDGGVYDNIPIDRALRAIAMAPASGPSERHLIYLDPEPPPRSGGEPDPARRTVLSWLPVILGARKLQQRAETADNELNLVRDHNDAVLANRGRLEALAATLRADPPNASPDVVPIPAYAQRRIATDAERIAALLTNPWADVCQPPFAGGDYRPAEQEWVLGVKDVLGKLYGGEASAEALSCDVTAVTEQVQVLLAWTRALEDLHRALAENASPLGKDVTVHVRRQFDDMPAALRPIKRTLYRWLTVLSRARYVAVDSVLAQAVQATSGPLPTGSQRSGDAPDFTERLAELVKSSRSQQQELKLPDAIAAHLKLDASDDDGPFLNALATEARTDSVQHPLLTQPNRDNGVASKSVRLLHRRLLSVSRIVVDAVAASCDGATVEARMQHVPPWTDTPFAVLYLAPWRTATIGQIARLYTVSGIPDTASIVKFDRITSDEPATDAANLSTLAAGARASLLRQWLRQRPSEADVAAALGATPADLITADAKLAGNAVQRFGGFALTSWRRNDWLWGRRDAAAALARILSEARRTERQAGEAAEDYELRRRQEIATSRSKTQGELHKSLNQDEEACGGTLTTNSVGAQTLDAVSPRYRFALASRLVPLIYRGVLPDGSARWTTRWIAWAIQFALVRPLAVVAPLVADPLRAVSVLAVVLACASLLGVSGSPRPLHILYGALLIAGGVVICVRTAQAYRNRRDVRGLLDAATNKDSPWLKLISGRGDRAIRARALVGVVGLAVGLALITDLVMAWDSGDPALGTRPNYLAVPLETFLAVGVALYAGQSWLHRRAHAITVDGATPHTTNLSRRMTAAANGTVLLAVAVGSSLGALHGSRDVAWTVVVAAIAAALLTIISLAGWTQWGWHSVTSVAAIAALAASAQYFFDHGWNVTENDGVLDLLPVAMWMVALGAVVSAMPCRSHSYGDPQIAAASTSRS